MGAQGSILSWSMHFNYTCCNLSTRMCLSVSVAMASLLVLFCAFFASPAAAAEYLVWPLPQKVDASGPPLSLALDFSISTSFGEEGILVAESSASRLAGAAARYTKVASLLSSLAPRAELGPTVKNLHIVVVDGDSKLGRHTRYGYDLKISEDGVASAVAESIYGAMYAMETFVQLIGKDGRLLHSDISVHDTPQFNWRGVMIDTGRRFVPMDVVRNLLDTMAANKLNVLHLHASDHCRFAVESKRFPQLTGSLDALHAGFYTQEDVKEMVSYAGALGIRVVPEFDVPGHALGLRPLESDGLKFCTADYKQGMVYGDPGNSTFNVLRSLFEEMAELFEDEVFNIGGDETAALGPCSLESTRKLELSLLEYLTNNLNKTSEGWQEMLLGSGAAMPSTIVDSWTGDKQSLVTARDRRTIVSASPHFYLNSFKGGGLPETWQKAWYDILEGVPESQQKLVRGGEVSLWTDNWCYIEQCGAFTGTPPPIGHALFDPRYDAEFSRAFTGMLWPAGYVGAGSFWNYDARVDATSADFVAAIHRLNDNLAARGSWVCPTGCKCDEVSACGKPYISSSSLQESTDVKYV